MILDHPNCFGLVQIVLVMSKLFWSGPNHFVQVYIRLFWTNFHDLDLSKMIWTRPKQIGPVQNNWCLTKMIWSVQNHFGPIEGQGISDIMQFRGSPLKTRSVIKSRVHCIYLFFYYSWVWRNIITCPLLTSQQKVIWREKHGSNGWYLLTCTTKGFSHNFSVARAI